MMEFGSYEEEIVILDRESNPGKNRKRKKEKSEVYKAKKKKKVTDHEPELPENLRSRIKEMAEEFGDSGFDYNNVVCVIQKKLRDTDINRKLNRLAIAKSQVRSEFLNADEDSIVSEKKEGHKHNNDINVPIIEPTGGTQFLPLTKWRMGCGSAYVFSGEWKDVVSLNQLEVGQFVHVWAFRILGRLHMAFVFSPNHDEASTSR